LAPPRFVALHGHFYQPPRENPWLETVEVQDSAAPYHDWNERVTAECYEPNTAARRVDRENRILDIVNNFEKISFNVGPTLLAWLERHRGDVYARIVEADRVSARARGGHGNAIAQVYNHMIMRWLRADRSRRSGGARRLRWFAEPEGMWLLETAADGPLAVLAEAGVRSRSLAPQAWRATAGGVGEVGSCGSSRPICGAAAGQSSRFFYDGSISRAIAFETRSKRETVERLRGFSDARTAARPLCH
jgi:alpha-amylase/alpha-mannosidase (GH57 family)